MKIELKWEKTTIKDRKTFVCTCPYCDIKISANSHTRLVDAELGSIKYHIYQCPECYMPIIVGLDNIIIPSSLHLPFEDIDYLPNNIEKVYTECRKTFQNECYLSCIMLARSIIMYVAVDLGAKEKQNFTIYIDFLVEEGHIAKNSRGWVDTIRKYGNRSVHEIEETTKDGAALVLTFLMHLLISVYMLPKMSLAGVI